jgi:hypothetical protein
VLSKVPLAVGLVALIFAVGSLFGLTGITAIVGPKFADFFFWIGVVSSCLVVLALYSLLLQKLGLSDAANAPPRAEEQLLQPPRIEPAAAADH